MEELSDGAASEVGRVNMYDTSVMESEKAALTIAVKASGGMDFKYAALAGVVDQTSEALPSGNGRSAMGPPRAGKNR